jgi:hypothetical protein
MINTFLPELMVNMMEERTRAVQQGAGLDPLALTPVSPTFTRHLGAGYTDAELAQKVQRHMGCSNATLAVRWGGSCRGRAVMESL